MYANSQGRHAWLPHSRRRLRAINMKQTNNNPNGARQVAAQQRFTIIMWTGVVADSLVVLPPRLYSRKYLVFIQEVPQEMLNDFPAHSKYGFNMMGAI